MKVAATTPEQFDTDQIKAVEDVAVALSLHVSRDEH